MGDNGVVGVSVAGRLAPVSLSPVDEIFEFKDTWLDAMGEVDGLVGELIFVRLAFGRDISSDGFR
jgi:hypothetical protein